MGAVVPAFAASPPKGFAGAAGAPKGVAGFAGVAVGFFGPNREPGCVVPVAPPPPNRDVDPAAGVPAFGY